MILIGDTGGVIAAFNRSSLLYASAREALFSSSSMIVAPLVLLELEHIMTRDFGRGAAYSVNDWLLKNAQSQRVMIPDVSEKDLRQARTVQNRYLDLELDLTDALNVVLAARYRTDCVLTTDERDFRAITPLTHHLAFRILPADTGQ